MAVIANALGVGDRPAELSGLQDSISIALINGVAAAIVTTLVLLVYQRSRLLNRLYEYLAAMELELRTHLGLTANSTAFTREGDFYRRQPADTFVGVLRLGHLVSSGVALVGVLSLRVYQDVHARSYWGVAVGLLFGILSMLFWVGYVRESWRGPRIITDVVDSFG